MRLLPCFIMSTLLLAACGQAPSDSMGTTASFQALGVPEDRDTAAMTRLLSAFRASDGYWDMPTGEAWQPALAIDAVINTYERTRDVQYLNVIEKSFQRYNGRRSYYFDDDGWYLNAWLRAYDVTGDPKYLDEAKSLFDVMKGAWNTTCSGGVWWNKDYNYKNAITNELFLLAAARLHRRAGNGTGAGSYYDWAMKEWNWFKNSGMINAQKRVNDGLNGSCQNNGGLAWTYNQGVILGGLVELWRITGDRGYLYSAEQIAEGTINNQVYSGGILKEAACEDTTCSGGDHFIFKGPFAQGLAQLYNADRGNKPAYGTFLTTNADSAWNNSRDTSNTIGFVWKSPAGTFNNATHAAGTLLIGEVALLNAGGETSTVPATSGTVYEAENATRTNLGTESTYSGYSGSGYVAGWNANGQSVTFNVSSSSARTAVVTIRYAAGAGDARRVLSANGTVRAADLLFTGTGAWGTYRTVSFNVPLNSGSNTVTLAYDPAKGSTNYLNLDRIEVK